MKHVIFFGENNIFTPKNHSRREAQTFFRGGTSFTTKLTKLNVTIFITNEVFNIQGASL